MQVIFVKSPNNEKNMSSVYLTDQNEYCSSLHDGHSFLKSNLENALHLGNYNGDIPLPLAYLSVSDVIPLFLFACKFQVSLPFLSHITLINMLKNCNNAFYTTNEVKQRSE